MHINKVNKELDNINTAGILAIMIEIKKKKCISLKTKTKQWKRINDKNNCEEWSPKDLLDKN